MRTRRRGFSFVEILFAVMILGIGFIMIAGVFPVAINQTQANGDETVAATMARQGVATIASLPNTAALMVPDGIVHRFGPQPITPAPPAWQTGTNYVVGTEVTYSGSFYHNAAAIMNDTITPDQDAAHWQRDIGTDPLWNELDGCQVLSEDPRFAWVPFYCRGKDPAGLPANSAQVTIIAVRVRNHDVYIPGNAAGSDMAITSGTFQTAIANLTGKPILITNVNATNVLAAPDQITLADLPGCANVPAVAPGTFVIIASDNPTSTNVSGGTTSTTAVGWVLKVGNPAPGTNTFYLQPGGDMKNSTLYKPAPTVATPLNAFVIGQGTDPSNPNDASGNPIFTGGTQDIMAYTTFVPLH